jgi:hypothetical protein
MPPATNSRSLVRDSIIPDRGLARSTLTLGDETGATCAWDGISSRHGKKETGERGRSVKRPPGLCAGLGGGVNRATIPSARLGYGPALKNRRYSDGSRN